MTSRRSSSAPATRSKARTSPGRFLRGSIVPMARRYRSPPASARPASARPVAAGVAMPEYTRITRSGGRAKNSRISAATWSLPVCRYAPRSIARRSRGVSSAASGRHSSGEWANARSWTETITGTFAGGAMKFGECTTSTGPVHCSMVGQATRAQSGWTMRAGIQEVAGRTPAGSRPARSRRPVRVIAYPVTATSSRVARPSTSRAVTWPMPVRSPMSGLASSATRRRGCAATGAGSYGASSSFRRRKPRGLEVWRNFSHEGSIS